MKERRGRIGDISLGVDFCSALQEKRDSGIMAPTTSPMERGVANLQRRMRGRGGDDRHYPHL
jgi:hypothetical protein